MKKVIGIALTAFLSSQLFFHAPVMAAGASFLISPGSGTYKVGQTFTVSIKLNSGGGAGVNAAEGVVKFDNSLLLATKTSYSGSIFELWTTKPSHSNTKGEITFAGGAPEAYTGSGGTIFTVTFSVLKSGTAVVKMNSGLALAADGKGTNILSSLGSASYTLSDEPKKETPAPAPPKEPVSAPAEPATKTQTTTKKPEEAKKATGYEILPPLAKITSPTHPDENIWYANNNPQFDWKLLSDVTGMSYDLTSSSTYLPPDKSLGVGESKKYEKIKDGIWYFHLKFQNKNGWGSTAHRKALVDVTPPLAYDIVLDNGGDPTNPSPIFRFKTGDQTSGVETYKVLLDATPQDLKASDFNGAYTPPALLPGDHTISVAAHDKAGNAASSSLKFFIEPMKSPVITEIPGSLTNKQALVVRGSSYYPKVTIKVYIAVEGKQPQEFNTKTDSEGNWNYFHYKTLDKGSYEIWAKLIDDRGAESKITGKHYLSVISPSIITAYGLYIILGLSLIMLLLALFIIFQRYKFKKEVDRIKLETDEMKRNMTKVFAALKEEVDELIEYADKKPGVTESEKRVRDKLKEALDISEEFITKDVTDIEKEIK